MNTPDEIDDADLYGPRHAVPDHIKREAARQWNEIPDTVAEIEVWIRGEPIQPKGDAL